MATLHTPFHRYLVANTADAIAAPATVRSAPPTGMFIIQGYQAFRVRPIGTTDNATFEFNAYAVDVDNYISPKEYTSVAIMSATVTCTVGTQAGISGGALGTSTFYCDTVDPAPGYSAWFTEQHTYATGSVTAAVGTDEYTPANDTFCELFFRGFSGVYGIAFSFETISAGSVNALYSMTTEVF